jgi:NAD-specific glutamate dehydrogenase
MPRTTRTMAPPKGRKRSIVQIQSMQQAQAKLATTASKDLAMSDTSGIVKEPSAAATQAGDSSLADKEHTVAELVEKLSLTEQDVLEKDAEILRQDVALQTVKILLDKSHDSVQAAKERGNIGHERYRADHKKLQRTEAMKERLKEQLKMVQDLHLASQKDASIALRLLEKSYETNASATEQLSDLMSDCASEVLFWKDKLAESKTLVRNLQARVNRAPGIQERTVAKALGQLQKDQSVFDLVKKGVYTPQARALARNLVTSGCSQDFVGILIQ